MMKKRATEKYAFLPYVLGILAVTIGYLPYLLLKENSIIGITDQLDGEIVAYYLRAKHLFDGSGVLPEIMCGMNRNALVPPSGLTVLFYFFFSPFWAFLLNQYLVLLIAFLGMYLLGNKVVNDKRIAFVVAGLFAFLPFFSVYGLSVAGLPMLAYAVLSLYRGEKKIRYYTAIVAYCFASSFVLIGFAVIGVLFLITIVSLLRKKFKKEFIIVPLLVLGCYLLQNSSLIMQVLGLGIQEQSHKEEIIIQGMSFWQGFKSVFWDGIGYAPAYQKYMIIPVGAVMLWGGLACRKWSEQSRAKLRLIYVLFAVAVGIGLFYATMHCHWGVQLRNQIGGAVKYFQVDRIYWFYPLIWYVILACVCSIVMEQLPKLQYVAVLLLVGVMGIVILRGSNFKLNLHQLIKPGATGLVSWADYFAEEQYAELAEYIKAETGMEQEEYRVASLGIQPAVAVMNDFYTIDMYSNNYALAYKHAFREIIAKELEKSAYNQAYFDGWGNRCYLCSAEYGFSAMFGKKDNVVYHDLELNTDKMAQMQCKYIISAGEIETADNMGLVLEKIFDTEDCYYRIYLYRIREAEQN